MTEPLREPRPPQVTVPPVEADARLAHRNNVFGLLLFGVFLALTALCFGVALLYLALD